VDVIRLVKLVEFKGDAACIQLHPHICTVLFFKKRNWQIKNKSAFIRLCKMHYKKFYYST